jgi:phosphonate transport system substrate-binding protein
MLTRRLVLAAAASALALGTTVAAHAADWKTQYPELTFALVPAENAADTTNRWQPMMDYLSKAIGVPVKLRIVNDYAAVVQGQKEGTIHIGLYGAASYARAVIVGAEVTPFGIEVNKDGSTGYYSVVYVKKDSPYQKLEDLKGKSLGLVDPNSTSGNNVPRFELNKLGIDPDKYFSKVVYAGTHENAAIGVAQGTFDACFNAWTNDEDSDAMKADKKGLLKYSDLRIIYKSQPILNGPLAYLNALPEDLKKTITDAFLKAYDADRAAFDKAYDGKKLSYKAITMKDYQPTIDLVKFVDELKKKS